MNRIDQRTSSDCLRCCIAMVLGLDYEDVPDFVAMRPMWTWAMTEWARRQGYWSLRVQSTSDGEMLPSLLGEAEIDGPLWIASGPAARGHNHAVVMRGSVLEFDPHASRAGLISMTAATVFVPIATAGEPRGPSADRSPVHASAA